MKHILDNIPHVAKLCSVMGILVLPPIAFLILWALGMIYMLYVSEMS